MLDMYSNMPIFILKLNIKIGLKYMGENKKCKLCSQKIPEAMLEKVN